MSQNQIVNHLLAIESQPRIGIQWRADEIYVRKFCAAVVDLLINLDNFFCSLDMSENQIVNYLRAIESQPRALYVALMFLRSPRGQLS